MASGSALPGNIVIERHVVAGLDLGACLRYRRFLLGATFLLHKLIVQQRQQAALLLDTQSADSCHKSLERHLDLHRSGCPGESPLMAFIMFTALIIASRRHSCRLTPRLLAAGIAAPPRRAARRSSPHPPGPRLCAPASAPDGTRAPRAAAAASPPSAAVAP